jgi:hypothetical protein
MAWEPDNPAWQYVLLDQLPPSVDVSQIEESLRRTPTERLERMVKFIEFLDEVRRASGNRLPKAD